MEAITEFLRSAQQGEGRSTQALIPLVYDELRRLAAYRLAQERPGQTLQATALVHEVYLRLSKSDREIWDNKRHFFGAAAEAMRRVLIENARRKGRQKRGGDLRRVELDTAELVLDSPSTDLLALNEALEGLEAVDREAAELVKLRFFTGLTQVQCAEVLGVSPRTADNLWAFARAWLHRALEETNADP